MTSALGQTIILETGPIGRFAKAGNFTLPLPEISIFQWPGFTGRLHYHL